MEISLNNIHSLTEFKRNANVYVEQVRNSLSPLVLTVNGEAAVIVQDAAGFQATIDRLRAVEAELQELKLAQLRSDLQVGVDQLDRGEGITYTEETIHQLFEDVKQQFPESGQRREEFPIGMRSFPAVEFIIFYRVFDDYIQIVRVLNGRRDIESIFKEPEN